VGRSVGLHPAELSKLLVRILGMAALIHAAERVGRGLLMFMPVVLAHEVEHEAAALVLVAPKASSELLKK